VPDDYSGRVCRTLNTGNLVGHISYLCKRGAVYHARMDVPEYLHLAFKTQTKKKSLGTKAGAQAKRRLWPVIAERQREFDDVMSRNTLVTSDREHAVWDHHTAVLKRDDTARNFLPRDEEIEAAKNRLVERIKAEQISATDKLRTFEAGLDFRVLKTAGALSTVARKIKLADMKKHPAKDEAFLIADKVDEYLRVNCLFITRPTPEWISLARHKRRAEIHALQRTLERDEGDFEPCLNFGDAHHQAAHHLASSVTSTPSLKLVPSMTFGNWFLPFRRSHFFVAASMRVNIISFAVFCESALLVRTVRCRTVAIEGMNAIGPIECRRAPDGIGCAQMAPTL